MTYVRETFVSLDAHNIARIKATTCATTPAVRLEATDADGRRVVSLSLHTDDYEIASEIADAINTVSAKRKQSEAA
jgi:flagellar basal body P-ring protein FlgI